MRNAILILTAFCLYLTVVPAAFAQKENPWILNGKWSIGAGGEFSANIWAKDKAPFVVSGKYWTENWEGGAEAFTSFEQMSKEHDQVGQLWIAYRRNVFGSDNTKSGSTYLGIGASTILMEWDQGFYTYGSDFGPMVVVGWDSNAWGAELKAAYYDPLVISTVVYYHFGRE